MLIPLNSKNLMVMNVKRKSTDNVPEKEYECKAIFVYGISNKIERNLTKIYHRLIKHESTSMAKVYIVCLLYKTAL